MSDDYTDMVMEGMQGYIVIVCIPYTGKEYDSYRRSRRIVRALRKKQITVFSPILHTHYYDRFMKFDDKMLLDKYTEDYVQWDLDLYEEMLHSTVLDHIGEEEKTLTNMVMLFTHDWEQSEGCQREFQWGSEHHVTMFKIDDTKYPFKVITELVG